MSSEKQLPSVKELFQESWNTLKTSAAPLFKLTLLTYGVVLAIGMIGLLLFFVFGVMSVIGSTSPADALLNPVMLIPILAIFVVGLVGLLVLSVTVVAAQMLIIDAKGVGSIRQHLRKGFDLVPAIWVAGILSTFLTVGSMFVFIFPMIIFAFLLIFVNYEVILNKQKPMAALKRSYALVTENFFEILVRWLAIMGLYILISFIIPNLLIKISPELAILVAGISFIVNILLTWFMLIYSVLMYKHVAKHSSELKEKSIAWMWIVAIIGWIIAGLFLFAGYKVLSSGILDSLSKSKIDNTMYLTPSPAATETQDVMQKPAYTAPSTAPVANCTQYNIREGEFASNKCYAKQDYSDLIYYGQRFNDAIFDYNAATNSMNVTCNGFSESFKAQCEQNQKDKAAAEADMAKYRAMLKEIIARGK